MPHRTHPWRAPIGPASDDVWRLVDRGSLLTALDVDDPTDLLDDPDNPDPEPIGLPARMEVLT